LVSRFSGSSFLTALSGSQNQAPGSAGGTVTQTEKVKVHEADGEIRLTPIIDTKKSCPLRGLCADGKLSSYSFIERKQAEKELER